MSIALPSKSKLIVVRQSEKAFLHYLGVGLIVIPFAATYAWSTVPRAAFTRDSITCGVPLSPSLPGVISPTEISLHSNGVLQGIVADPNGAALAAVKITSTNLNTDISRLVQTDGTGFYQFTAMPVGTYLISGQITGFKTQIVDGVRVEVGQTTVLNLRLDIGDISEQVRVDSNVALVNNENVSVGQVINQRMVQEIPLNGRYFIDLGLLVAGSVTPPQSGFLTTPTRGGGSLGFNTAGNREDTANFQINGMTLNDQINNTLIINPPLTSIREFKIDNSTFSAETGRSSGTIVSLATLSGTREFHGELYEYFRNNALDARNYFNFASANPPPYKRNQFGGAIGGPVVLPRFGDGSPALWNGKDSTYFYFTYESLQQRQGVDINTLVLSEAQRASVTDPIIGQLIQLIPRSNFSDSSGAPRFSGSARAIADVPQWTLDISHNFSDNDNIHGFYVYQDAMRNDPNAIGATIPGFGDIRTSFRQVLTVNESHIFAPDLVNQIRFGLNILAFNARARAEFNPAGFGINVGVDQAIGLPQINIAGGFSFGGPPRLPLGQDNMTMVVADTVSYLSGRHSFRLGGEYRLYRNHNILRDTGTFNFPTVAAFIAGNANSFLITQGTLMNTIRQGSVGTYIQDSYKLLPNLTLDLGFRYDLHQTPTEQDDRFVVFDPKSVTLRRVGQDIEKIHRTIYTNFQPRVGFAWDPFGDGKTSVRAGYGIYVEQPATNAAANTSVNPPLATPIAFAGTIRLDNALSLATATGLSPVTIDHNYINSNIQSWNLNLQRELVSNLVLTVGYFGSKGTHLRIARNINQPVNGIRPFQRLSLASPQLPGVALGNIVQIESSGNSSYNSLWATLTKRFSHNLQFSVSYTWSKSIDYNSYSAPPQSVTVQNSYDLRNDRGLSDFDVRHRFVFNAIYELPFRGNRFREGWQLGVVVQDQTGNPVNIVTSSSTVNGIANTVRPDVVGAVDIPARVDQWFDQTKFIAVPRFGSLGRNVLIGPGFRNVDFSALKNTKLNEDIRLQFRAEFFDLFNHANFGQPGRVVGAATFGRITNTRFPTGDSGSSRQMQFVIKLIY